MLRTAAQDSVCRKARELMLPIPPKSAPSAKAAQSSRQGPFSELDGELQEPPRRCTTSPDIRGPPGPHQVRPALAGPLAHPPVHPPSGPLWGDQTATSPKGIPVQPQDLLSCFRVPTLAPGAAAPPVPPAPPPEGLPSGSEHVLGSGRSHPQRRQLPSRSQQAPVLSGLQRACQGHRPATSPPPTPGLASSSFARARSPASAPHLLCEAPAAPGGPGPRIRTAPQVSSSSVHPCGAHAPDSPCARPS